MTRPRTIDQDAVLAAAEAVVARKGAANLTLDAVAAEAGISKASVTYDYGSKQCLIKAVIERSLRLEEDRIQASVDSFGEAPAAEILGRITAIADADVGHDHGQAAALNLCSALAQDEELHSLVRDFYRRQFDAIQKNTENRSEATIAFLAIEGLKTLKYFGFYSWPAGEREKILKDIAASLPSGTPIGEASS